MTVCQNAVVSFPATTLTGLWSPSSINTSAAGTFTYTFTPDITVVGQECAVSGTLSVTVNPTIAPTFSPITVCQNAVVSFPATTLTGLWSPSSINTSGGGTFTYTFTPDITVVGQECAVSGTLSVTVNPTITPTFSPMTVCKNAVASFPASALTGTWSPLSIDTAATGVATYTFTPDITVVGQECAVSGTLSVTVTSLITPTFAQIAAICEGATTVPVLPVNSINNISGTWNPSVIDTSTVGPTVYTFNPNSGQCASIANMTITIIAQPSAYSPLPVSACDSYPLPPLTSGSYYTLPNGQGNNLAVGSIISTTQTLYVYAQSGTTPNCTDENSFTVTISPSPDFIITGECVGSVYVLEVDGTNIPSNAIYYWTDSLGNHIGGNTSTLEVTNTGIYYCDVTISSSTCHALESWLVDETACQIQRGISPNNDGNNEFFDLSGFNVKELSIYNRYGTKVYSKTDYVKEWTGKDLNNNDLPDGTYYYMFERKNSETKVGWIYINREKK